MVLPTKTCGDTMNFAEEHDRNGDLGNNKSMDLTKREDLKRTP